MKKYFNIFILTFLGITFSSIAQESKKIRIAIFDFKAGESITKKEANMITDMVRTEMIQKKKFTVIDRENIKTVLAEQGLIQKGCTDTSCEVKLGKMLAANKIMTGSISKLGNSYIITSHVTDVEKGTNDFADKEKTKTIDDMDSAIKELTDKISDAMAGSATDEPQKTTIKKNNEPTSKPNQFTISPIFKSVFIPGWGQYSNGEKIKGSFIFASFLITTGVLVSEIKNFENTRSAYQTTSNMTILYPSNLAILGYMNSQSLHSTFEKQGQQATNLSALLVGIYLYNVIDIVFFSKNENEVKASFLKKDGLNLNTGTQTTNSFTMERTISIHYTWSF